MARRSHQLALDLQPTPRWGGRREGSGRKPGRIRRDPHRRRAPLHRAHPCHVTLKIRRGLPSLRSRRLVAELEHSLREACARGRFRVVQARGEATAPDRSVGADRSGVVRSLVRRLARGTRAVARLSCCCGAAQLASRRWLAAGRTHRPVRDPWPQSLSDGIKSIPSRSTHSPHSRKLKTPAMVSRNLVRSRLTIGKMSGSPVGE
jgi:hypothetical protein